MNQDKALNFLYNTTLGRIFLKPMISKPVSRLGGCLMRSSLSKIKINSFLRDNSVDMSDFEERSYSSFNDFFTRRLRPGARRLAGAAEFICPCDGCLSAYEITPELLFFIKGAPYSVKTLVGGDAVADAFAGGSCLVFRLKVENYHHYHYFDDGKVIKGSTDIKGVLHTVNPIALGQYNFFHQNSRSYTVIDTAHFGMAVYCEVGAMLVGRIVNLEKESFCGGDEKGYFEFGGSTVVVLINKDYRIADRFYANTQNGIETPVKFGEALMPSDDIDR